MSQVIGLILSGGAGSRLGGVNKGLVDIEGVPLIHRVYERLAPQVGHIYISANEDLDVYRRICDNLVQDDARFFRNGPLAGVHSLSLKVESDDFIQVVTCDLPLLPKNLVDKQLQYLQENCLDAVYPFDGERAHYGAMLFRASCLNMIEPLLLNQQRRIRDFLDGIKSAPLEFEDANAFMNGNDWDSIEKIARLIREEKC